MANILTILIASILIQNIALYSLLGMCPFISLSRSLKTATGMGWAVIFVVLLPLAALTGVVTGEAIKVSQTAMPWVKAQVKEPGVIQEYLSSLPYYDKIAPHRDLILHKAGEMVGLGSSG